MAKTVDVTTINSASTQSNKQDFAALIVKWQLQFGRKNLPWMVSDPYKIWVSEIMLQQTQVKTVLSYYPKFIKAFPTVSKLANAPLEQVLDLWAGLGYYSRAKNLHHSAQQIVLNYQTDFPQNRLQWQELKGIGRSTAAAIVAFAFKQKETILDGNVKRILARIYCLPYAVNDSRYDNQMWALAESLLPTNAIQIPSYIQGLMDLGAGICLRKNPLCHQCPISKMCSANEQRQTDVFPKVLKKNPTKKINYYWPMIFDQQQHIFLVARENKGIWPGLLTPPTFELEQDMRTWLNENGFNAEQTKCLTIVKHKLTHREMTIHAFELEVKTNHLDNYYSLPQIINGRIPTPLKNLLVSQYLKT